MNKKYKNKNGVFGIVFSIVVSVMFVFAVTNAATTITTNINTGGTLTVTGASTLTGDLAVDTDTLYVDVSAGRVGIGTTTPSAFFSVGEAGGTVTGDAYFTGGLTVGGTASINSIDGSILFAATASDPTGVTQGTVYYNSTSKVLRLFDGSNWFTVGTTTSGLTLSGQRLQLANLATDYMTFGTTTQSGLSVLTLEATSTTAIPLTIRGYNAQTANLLQVHNVAGTEVFALDAAGNASTTMVSTTGNIWANGYATTTGASGNIATEGTLTVGTDGAGTDVTFYTDVAGEELLWDASANKLTIDGSNGANALEVTDGNVAFTDNLTVSGTTVLGTSGSTVTGFVFGDCNIADTAITASSSAYADCTGATGIALGDRVFVTATSSLPVDFIIQAASSTDTDTINLRIYNSGITAQTTTGARALNFMGIR